MPAKPIDVCDKAGNANEKISATSIARNVKKNSCSSFLPSMTESASRVKEVSSNTSRSERLKVRLGYSDHEIEATITIMNGKTGHIAVASIGMETPRLAAT